MIKAGHPTPAFELAYFSDPAVYEDRHWKDPEGDKYYNAKQWVIGQAVCARDAMKQVVARASGGADADAVKDAVNQALGHYTNLKDATGDADVAKNLDAVESRRCGQRQTRDGRLGRCRRTNAKTDRCRRQALPG